MKEIEIVAKEGVDCLRIKIISRLYPKLTDCDSGNWLNAEIILSYNGSENKVQVNLRTYEFDSFLRSLEALYESKKGKAKFDALEEWLVFNIVIDEKEYFTVEGVLKFQLGYGDETYFSINVDKSYLPQIISQIREVLNEFPVVGRQ